MTGSRFVAAVFAGAVVAVVGAPTAVGAAVTLTYRVVAGSTSSGTIGFNANTSTGTAGAPKLTLTDSRTSTTVGCIAGHLHGSATLGRTRTARIATVTAMSASRCTAFNGYVSLTPKGVGTWLVNGVSRTTNGVTALALGNVRVAVTSPTCSFTMSGSTDGSYSNSKRWLTVKPRAGSGHVLRASGVTGCGGVINNGDVIAMVGVFGVSTHKGALRIS